MTRGKPIDVFVGSDVPEVLTSGRRGSERTHGGWWF
jgi:hypothetical protein